MYCSKKAGFAESRMGQEMVRQTPLGRLGRPDDIAAVMGFLASGEACWVTGQVIQTSRGLFLG
jgi:3-oxoacyl-[acyl-carrier protein] reductase